MKTFVKVFIDASDFAAQHQAEEWLKARGYSVGRMQGADPIGVKYGDWDIQKWRHLSPADVADLDGQITGNKRNGPVTVTLRDAPNGEAS